MAEVSRSNDAAAFRRLYPDQHYDQFLENGVRPDGRVLGLSREVTVGLDAVSSADSSALVKLGSTIVMAGVKLEVMKPSDEEPEAGSLVLGVEVTPMSAPDVRPGRTPEAAHSVAEQLHAVLATGGALDATELCIRKSSAAWVLYCDVYVLNSDGCLLDACLIAAVAALSALKLPEVPLTKDGQVIIPGSGGEVGSVVETRRLRLKRVPLSLTCGLRGGQLISDPTAEEEQLMESLITVALDEQGELAGVYKPGGEPVTDALMQECIQLGRVRYKTVSALLEQALQQRDE